ncbi:MAG: NAD(P)H-dependent oxidoreductase [Brevundimonas sp.]|nr:NAD(P)H-dependent oxidoreductase [Brevundimonas sp.]
MTRVLILDGHPDADEARFCHALADAYASGAKAAGHEVRRTRLCDLEFPDLMRRDDWESAPAPPVITVVQQDIAWAQHLVILYPLWLGGMPARLKALFEQTFRPGFAFGQRERSIGDGRLKGRSARVIVTMGMPAVIYRGFYFSHSLQALKRNILSFVGIGPTRSSIVGNVEGLDETRLKGWLDKVSDLGGQAR